MTIYGAQDLSPARALRLHASTQALLYDVQSRVRRGYVWWTSGEVPSSKILAVVSKLADQYGTFASASARSRRKAAGQPSAVLLVYPARHDRAGYTTLYRFVLLASTHLDGEVMYDARRRPLRITLYRDGGGEYSLQPSVAQASGDRVKVDYVWQLSPKAAERMEQQFTEAASQELAAFQKTLYRYRQLPMTSGYRKQLKAALQSALPTWRRNTRPSVYAYKQQVKKGEIGDPFKEPLPFISGFVPLYDNPPLTLGMALRLGEKQRRDIERRQLARLAHDHQADAK